MILLILMNMINSFAYFVKMLKKYAYKLDSDDILDTRQKRDN